MRDAHGERKDAETAVNRQRKRGEIPWAVADVLAGKVSPYPAGRPGRGRQAEACDPDGEIRGSALVSANGFMLLSFWQESALATAAPAEPCRATHRQLGV